MKTEQDLIFEAYTNLNSQWRLRRWISRRFF